MKWHSYANWHSFNAAHHTLFHSINSSPLFFLLGFIEMCAVVVIHCLPFFYLFQRFALYTSIIASMVFCRFFSLFPIHTFVWCECKCLLSFAFRTTGNLQAENLGQYHLRVASTIQMEIKTKKKKGTINKNGKQYQPTYYLDSGSFQLQRSWVFRLVYLFRCCCCLLT